ncbi:MAG: HPF/RaiA family ribosome-associated protein [Planctomycetota bacterium]
MHIEISYQNLPHSDKLNEHVHETLSKRFARFGERLTRVEVHLGDVNEHKKGPDDKRCMIEVRPAGRDPIAVEEHADDRTTP